MTGSLDEADDLVQDTFANAWRSRETYEGRAGLRTWLYRIATRVCLKALERAERRPLPSDLTAPNAADEADVDTAHHEIVWLQPYPDDPADLVEQRQHVRLALVAALQYLAPRQRAVLIFREVLDWSAREVADALGTTVAAVNSALQRARATLRQPVTDLAEPDDPHVKELLDGYAKAFERADATGLAELLTKDATWQMPPIAAWFAGRTEVVAFLHTRLTTPGAIRMVPTTANGQPAFALYAGDEPHAIHVLEVTREGIAGVVAFHDPKLFAAFGLPTTPARR